MKCFGKKVGVSVGSGGFHCGIDWFESGPLVCVLGVTVVVVWRAFLLGVVVAGLVQLGMLPG